MADVDPFELIDARAQEIVKEVDRLEKRIAELAMERSRLVEMMSLLRGLYKVTSASPVSATEENEEAAEEAERLTSRAKPGSAPPMPTMIEKALTVAHQSGVLGLAPLGITNFVRGHYWPNADVANVGPITWRMWKRGQLGKDGSLYHLPNRDSIILEGTKLPMTPPSRVGQENGSEAPTSDPSEVPTFTR